MKKLKYTGRFEEMPPIANTSSAMIYPGEVREFEDSMADMLIGFPTYELVPDDTELVIPDFDAAAPIREIKQRMKELQNNIAKEIKKNPPKPIKSTHP